MFGGLLALLSAVTFAFANASVRRGVLTGTVFQAVMVSVALGLPLFAAAALIGAGLPTLMGLPAASVGLLAAAGIIHFVVARYCNYRATKAMGTLLVAPMQQLSLVITLVLAVIWLGEQITPLRLAGVVLIFAGPALILGTSGDKPNASRPPTNSDGSTLFKPDYKEGYTFSLLSTVGFGTSPILIRLALHADGASAGLAGGLAGGLISYAAAAAVMSGLALLPKQRNGLTRMDEQSFKWFAISGIAVCFSQMFRYMALAIAPVSVVSPIQRLSLIFRFYFGHALNRHHEFFGGRVVLGTAISLIGAVALTISIDNGLHMFGGFTWIDRPLVWN